MAEVWVEGGSMAYVWEKKLPSSVLRADFFLLLFNNDLCEN